MARTEVSVLPEYNARYPEKWMTRIEITLTGGSTLSASVDYPKGDPENPLSEEELATKFRILAQSGGYESQAGEFIAWVHGLENAETLHFPETLRG